MKFISLFLSSVLFIQYEWIIEKWTNLMGPSIFFGCGFSAKFHFCDDILHWENLIWNTVGDKHSSNMIKTWICYRS